MTQISLQSSPLLVDGAIKENGSDMGPPWPIERSIGLRRESKLRVVGAAGNNGKNVYCECQFQQASWKLAKGEQ